MLSNERVVVGLAATFAGLTAVLLVGGLAVSPVMLAVAVPFAFATYFLWYHASGRLRARVRRQATGASARDRRRARQRARAAENRRAAFSGDRAGSRERQHRERRRRGGQRRSSRRNGRRDRAPPADGGPTVREAYATLDLSTDADEAAVKRAYREKAKELHPDAADGDEEAFKELNAAYERLQEGSRA
ncbi:J domain-containing protein [Haloparvum sedimenti]|uniref:J domain-containing protein n=1 Tax=Haloparvum sedimenti TaxID=1678448 RepID=UPI00071E75FF|nr:J domain-containing protein [Haloparvum sedimenti]